MIKTLMIGLPIMLGCLLIQVASAYWSVRNFIRQSERLKTRPGFFEGCLPLMIAMLIMMVGNLLQVTLWGVLFVVLGEFDDLRVAVYHSGVNYASLGYGDIVMSADWKILGPIEALNGVLMLGMTSAALMVMLQQMIARYNVAAGRKE